jgi:hypothetical protein
VFAHGRKLEELSQDSVDRLGDRKPMEDPTNLPALTDRTRARSCAASTAFIGTPPPLPLGAAVCFPLATNLSSSRGAIDAILLAIFFAPLPESLLEDPPLSADQTDAPPEPEVTEFLRRHPATGDTTRLGSGVVEKELKRSAYRFDSSFSITFSTTFLDRAPRAAMIEATLLEDRGNGLAVVAKLVVEGWEWLRERREDHRFRGKGTSIRGEPCTIGA